MFVYEKYHVFVYCLPLRLLKLLRTVTTLDDIRLKDNYILQRYYALGNPMIYLIYLRNKAIK